LHPDFHSTRLALAVADEHRIPSIAVQHHHAHIAVALAEHGVSETVIGLALDGTGLGDDGQAWGGEILLGEVAGQGTLAFRRIDHLALLAMPGADAAAREPWRLGAAVLHALGREHEITPRYRTVTDESAIRTVRTMLQRDLQCPRTSSAGRWFDAAAAALGLCTRQSFEAEAAITLQRCAQQWLDEHPEFDQPWGSLDLYPLFDELFALGTQGGSAQARGAAMFHLALANGLARHATQAAKRHGATTVVLGGGCFVNRILRESLTKALVANGIRVLMPEAVSCGDEGLALGQAWFAAQSLCATADTAAGVSLSMAVGD
jgi:hydrogenase maturation protein HypF